MSQAFDRQILDYLARKENLPLALEIGNYAVQLRRELIEKFWKDVHSAVVKASPEGRNAGEFIFRHPDQMDASNSSLRMISKSAVAQSQQLAFALEHEQAADRFDLYVGLLWTAEVPASDPLYEQPPLRRLKQRLMADGWIDWAPWWVCGHYVHQFPSPENFLCAYADDPAGVMEPLTTAFWDMIKNTEMDVAAVNKLLAGT